MAKIKDLKLSDLEFIKALSRHSTLKELGKEYGMTTLQVHRRLAGLSDYFSTDIYKHKGYNLQITDDGEILLENIDRIFEILKDQKSEDKGLIDKEIHRKIRISTTQGLGLGLLSKQLTGFFRDNPELYASIQLHTSVHDLQRTFQDLIIWTELPLYQGWRSIKLNTFHFGLFASQDYVDRYGLPQTREELKDHKLITFSHYRNSPFTVCSNALFDDVNFLNTDFHEINHSLMLYELIKSGCGIGVVSLEFPEPHNLIRVLPELETETTCYIYARLDSMNRYIEDLVERIVESVNKGEH